jgi:hypothetical protein
VRLKLFFPASKAVAARLTDLFDFAWPTAVAIWNLRWQVTGLIGVVPQISYEELQGRFVAGSGIRGANLRRACTELSWEDQQQQFARFLMFEFCAIYESWCEEMAPLIGLNDMKKKNNLQFPSSFDSSGRPSRGIRKVLSSLPKPNSPFLIDSFSEILESNSKYSVKYLEELFLCYRYFKEIRNSLIHNGGTLSADLIDAENKFRSLTPIQIGMKEVPAAVPSIGQAKRPLVLRGVVGFGEVVLRIVCSLDAEIAKSESAENYFKARWRIIHGKTPLQVSATDANRRASHIRKLVAKLDLPKPPYSMELEEWLRENRMLL